MLLCLIQEPDGAASRFAIDAAWHRLSALNCFVWSRFVALEDVKRLVLSFDTFVSPAHLEHALGHMDLQGLHDITLEEFQELMDTLAAASEGRGIAQAFRPVLTAYFLSLKDWAGQLRCGRP